MSTELTVNAGLDRFRTGIMKVLEDSSIIVKDSGGLMVASNATEDQVADAAQKLVAISQIHSAQKRLIDQYLGQLIITYAAMTDKSWSESISCMNLTEDTGRAFKTLMKLPRMVEQLPEEVFNLNLTSGHLEAATSFAGPKDPSELGNFNKDKVAILHKAAENPVERNKTWVAEQMRELQRQYGVAPSRTAPVGDARKAYEVYSQALIEWTDEDYSTFGVTRGVLLDRWRGYRDDLIERGILADDSSNPEVFSLPNNNHGRVIDVEVITNGEGTEEVPS